MTNIPENINKLLLQIFKSQDKANFWWISLDKHLQKVPYIMYQTEPQHVLKFIYTELDPNE